MLTTFCRLDIILKRFKEYFPLRGVYYFFINFSKISKCPIYNAKIMDIFYEDNLKIMIIQKEIFFSVMTDERI